MGAWPLCSRTRPRRRSTASSSRPEGRPGLGGVRCAPRRCRRRSAGARRWRSSAGVVGILDARAHDPRPAGGARARPRARAGAPGRRGAARRPRLRRLRHGHRRRAPARCARATSRRAVRRLERLPDMRAQDTDRMRVIVELERDRARLALAGLAHRGGGLDDPGAAGQQLRRGTRRARPGLGQAGAAGAGRRSRLTKLLAWATCSLTSYWRRASGPPAWSSRTRTRRVWSRPCAGSTSRSRRARPWPCWAPTARASRRRSTCCSAWRDPDAGTVSVMGRSPADAVAAGLIGAMLQSGALIRDLTVRELIGMVASLYPRAMTVAKVLELVGISDVAERKTQKLSGGQTQRVRFAVALVADPELLDPRRADGRDGRRGRHGFWARCARSPRGGRTVIFATHYLEEADDNADRIVLMAHGRLVADGAADRDQGARRRRTIRATLAAVAPSGCRSSGGSRRRATRRDGVPELHRLRRGDPRAARRATRRRTTSRSPAPTSSRPSSS